MIAVDKKFDRRNDAQAREQCTEYHNNMIASKWEARIKKLSLDAKLEPLALPCVKCWRLLSTVISKMLLHWGFPAAVRSDTTCGWPAVKVCMYVFLQAVVDYQIPGVHYCCCSSFLLPISFIFPASPVRLPAFRSSDPASRSGHSSSVLTIPCSPPFVYRGKFFLRRLASNPAYTHCQALSAVKR